MFYIILDVISIDRTSEYFRLIYNIKGHFLVHRITPEEAKVRLLELYLFFMFYSGTHIWVYAMKLNAAVQLLWVYPFYKTILFTLIDYLQYKLCRVTKIFLAPKAVPVLTTHDGRTIRYPNPSLRANDVIQLNIDTGKIMDHIKFDIGRFFVLFIFFSSGLYNCLVLVYTQESSLGA